MKMRTPLLGLLLLAGGFIHDAQAVPVQVPYSGQLADNGELVSGTKAMRFQIMDAQTNGTSHYDSGQINVQVSNGAFSVVLGGNPLPTLDQSVFNGDPRWLEISVGPTNGTNLVILSPRQPVRHTPYSAHAFSAGNAEALGGLAPTGYASSNHTHVAGDIVAGVFSTARLNVGTNAGTVAAGDHTHDDRYYTRAAVDALLSPLFSRLTATEAVLSNLPPPTPFNLSATVVSSNAILLAWQYYTTPLEQGFRIERSTDGGTNFAEIAVMPADSTSYTNASLPPGTTNAYRVRAYNAAGNSPYSGTASAATPAAPTVVRVLLVDPPVVHSAAPFQMRVFTAGLTNANPATQLKLIAADLTETNLSFSAPSSANELLASIPVGLAAGAWTVRVTSQSGNSGNLPDGLLVVSTASINQVAVNPDHVSPSQVAALSLTCQPGTTAYAQFARAYLAPTNGGAAFALQSVLYGSASLLSAQSPAGLTPGSYHLMVINPDGSAGLQTAALTVLSNEPPLITGIALGHIINSSGQSFTVRGSGFGSPQVTLLCRSPLGITNQLSCSVGSLTSTSLVATVDASSLTAGSIAVVNLVNSDGGAASFSSLAIANPSLSANPWSAGPTLLTARRAPALVHARRNSTQGFLHTIGGDNGMTSGAYATVESAPLDAFGQLGAWSFQRNSLPEGRTFVAAAVIGQFVYVVGGKSSSSTLASVLRARILDTAPAPAVPNFSVAVNDALGGGVSAGTVQYRIAALYPTNDTANPGGESLPGGVVTLQLPAISNLLVRLSWPAMTGASGYRVYKAAGGGAFGLLAEVASPATTLDDTGSLTNAAQPPLPVGSLGVWHPVASMNTAREAHAVLVAPDPTVPGVSYLYAIGGRGSGGSAVSSFEYLSVTDSGPAMAWTPQVQTMSVARADLRAWVLNSSDNASVPPTEFWIYIGPGTTGTGSSYSSVVEATKPTAGGSLAAMSTTDSLSGNSAGYAAFVAKGQLYCTSGQNGASATTRFASPTGTFPDLTNWNAAGQSLAQARIYSGSAQAGAVLYIVGGYGGSGPPLSSTESATK